MKLYNFTKTEGFFFEAGAYDGVVVSNTLLMETMYNWTGKICPHTLIVAQCNHGYCHQPLKVITLERSHLLKITEDKHRLM